MSLLVYQNLPAELGKWLVMKGHNAVHVRDLGMKSATDAEIIEEARRRQAVIITKDEDFSREIGVPVVWICIGNSTNRYLFSLLENVLPQIVDAIQGGDFLVEVYRDA